MKKLIPALAMLLVAACLMGTSTYAWFSANRQVTASGMSVKAASEGGLAIASYTGTTTDGANGWVKPGVNDFKSSASAVWTNATGDVQPASLDAGTWHTGVAADVDSAAVNGEGYKPSTATKGLFQKTMWQIKSLAEKGTVDVAVTSITVEAADEVSSANLNKAIRVALAVYAPKSDADPTTGAATWYYFAPLASGNEFYYVNSAKAKTQYNQGATTPDDASDDTNKLTIGNASAVIYQGLTTAPISVVAYVYYEGEDANCMSANAINIDTLNVTITYNAQ